MVKYVCKRKSGRQNKPQDPRSIDRTFTVKSDIMKDGELWGTMLVSTDGTEHSVPILRLPKQPFDTAKMFKKLKIST